MKVENNSSFTFLGNTNIKKQEEMQLVKDVIPQLQNKNITLGKIDTETVKIDLSDEGLSAAEKQQYLRKAVQEMPDSSAINVEEMMQIREILPKLQMDPVYSHYEEMRGIRYEFYEMEKEEDEKVLSVEDTMNTWMKAYALKYDALIKGHEDGSRDVYVVNPGEMTASGNFVYHRVEFAEDMGYLDDAFSKATQAVSMVAQIQENRWQVRHIFHGDEPLGITLPKDYAERLQNMMKNAKDAFVEKYNAGAYADTNSMTGDIVAMTSKLLKEDEEFWKSMNRLFSEP